jgi:hypothetical protein
VNTHPEAVSVGFADSYSSPSTKKYKWSMNLAPSPVAIASNLTLLIGSVTVMLPSAITVPSLA